MTKKQFIKQLSEGLTVKPSRLELVKLIMSITQLRLMEAKKIVDNTWIFNSNDYLTIATNTHDEIVKIDKKAISNYKSKLFIN